MRLLFAAALTFASAAAASAQPGPGPRDEHTRELGRLIGTWSCQGATPGNASVEMYAAAPDGSITLENRVRASTGRAGVVVESFRFDSSSATWTLSAAPNSFFGGLHLQAPPWNGATWTLTGTEIVNDRPRPVRIVYTDLGTLGFRREHQAQAGTAWQDDAELTCRRDELPATPAPALGPTAAANKRTGAVGPSPVPSALPTASLAPKAVAGPVATPLLTAAAPTELPAVAATSMPSPSVLPRLTPGPPGKPSPAARQNVAWKFTPPVARATPAPTATPASRDRAYALAGTWACETIARDPGVHTYSVQSDGSLRMLNRLQLGKQTFQINEVYRYDAARQRWTNDTERGAYRGTATRWTGDDWTFDGVATERGIRTPVRMSYRSLGPSAFRRDFEKIAAGAWTTYASETCSRGGPRLP